MNFALFNFTEEAAELGKVVTRTRNLSLVQRKMSPEVNGKDGRSIRASRIRVKEPSNGGEELRVKSPRTSDGEELATSSGTSEGVADVLFGREDEVAAIESQVEKCIKSSCSVSMYISGPPGTGKTASVELVMRRLSAKYRMIAINVNCVSVNTEIALLKAVFAKLSSSRRNVAASKLRDCVENLLRTVDCPVVLILDEIDYIQSRNRAILYTAFQWPSQCFSLAVVAISNSLDLTERELPKLKLSKPPIVLPFSPYSKEDLQRILKNKLSSKNGIDERAVELCSRKVAAMTGDVRHAMQIAQQMLPEMRGLSDKRSVLKNEPTKSACPQVLGAVTNVYRSVLYRTRIPLQQKVLLAIILRLADKHSNTAVDRDLLLNAYELVCEMMSLPAADAGGANIALSLLESLSVIKLNACKCQLLVDVPTAVDFIADSTLLSQINNMAL
uniref:AAA domain-containing protein n=1 Tax=Ascaris lumbricoides TaxID=6252 RepID=A0A0M3HNX5_ASCLU